MADHDDKVGEHTEPSIPPAELLPSHERDLQIASQDMGVDPLNLRGIEIGQFKRRSCRRLIRDRFTRGGGES